jgi:FdhD protein
LSEAPKEAELNMVRHDPAVIPTAPSEIDDLCEVVDVSQITKSGRKSSRVAVVREVPLTIFLNEQEIVTLLCTGAHVESLAVGFLNSEGLLRDRGRLRGVEVDRSRHLVRVSSSEDAGFAEQLLGRRIITSGCGKGTIFYHVLDSLQSRPVEHHLALRAEQVRHLMGELNRRSELYRRSRGVHNCALALPGEIVLFRADIGRHNAVDMIIGECFLEGLPTRDKILLTTGRITSEILIKCAKAGIPALVSRSAATSLALQLARELKMTVIGYVRGGSMVVYAGDEHINHDLSG